MSKSPTRQPKSPSPKRRFRTVLLGLACLVPIVAGFTYRHYTDPVRVRAMAEAFLQRYSYGRVTVGSAKFSLLSGLRLFDVIIRQSTQGASSEFDKVVGATFSCREVNLGLGLVSTLLGTPNLVSIQAIEPTCMIVRDAVTGRFNVEGLLRLDDVTGELSGTQLPKVELRDAHVRLSDFDGMELRSVEDLKITVRARPVKRAPLRYDITWQTSHGRSSSGHAQIDFKTGRFHSVRGGLPSMCVEAVMLAVNAKFHGAREWNALLGLEGIVRVAQFDIGRDELGEPARSVTLELRDASLSIPIDEAERAIAPDQRYLRFDHVQGEVELTSARLIARFSGRLHGSECDVLATIRGGEDGFSTLDDVALDAKLTIVGVTLPRNDPVLAPAEARFVTYQPALEKIYDLYDPHGSVDLDLDVSKRAGRDQPFVLNHLRVDTQGVDFSHVKFPYRVRDVHGVIDISPVEIVVSGLHGLGTAGTVSIEGHFGNLDPSQTKRVSILGSGLPLDDALWASLPERFQSIRARYDPRGTIDLDIELTQSAEDDPTRKKWRSRTTVALRGVSATYQGFPYPLDDITGTLVIDRESVTLANVSGRADQARVSVDGSIHFDRGGITDVDVTIIGQGIPFNDRLYGALPDRTRREIEPFHPRGRFGSRTLLSWNADERRIEQSSLVKLEDVAIRYDRFPLPISAVSGQLQVSGTETLLEGLSGRYGDAKFEANGVLRRSGADAGMTVVVRGRNVRLDEELRRQLPSGANEYLRDWRIDGLLATETVLTSDSIEPDTVSQRTRVSLAGATISHPRLPVPLTGVRGDITIDHAGIETANLSAQYGSADVQLEFDADRPSESGCGAFAVSTIGLTLDESVRGLLPPQFADAWQRVNPSGTVSVFLDELRCERSDLPPLRRYTIRGRAELDNVSVGQSGLVSGTSGTLYVQGVINDRKGGTLLSGKLALPETVLEGHRVEQVQGEWSYVCTAGGEGMVTFRSMYGRMYDGLVSGDIDLEFSPKQLNYNVTATLRGMQLEPFLNVNRSAEDRVHDPIDASGTVHGRLYLSGTVGDDASPLGGGRFEIVEGHMYRLPLVIGILQVLNLSLPGEEAFEEVQAAFDVVGDRITFQDVRLWGKALALRGNGEMSWPDCGVDLSLFTVSPGDWTRVIPILPILIDGASRELVELHVTGPLSKPSVKLKPFRAIRDELEKLFEKKKSKPLQAVKP